MAEAEQQRFEIQRLYVKDLSVESPEAPGIFRDQWQPQINVDLNVSHESLGDDNYEVVLRVTVTMQKEKKNIAVIEVNHAGVFHLSGFEKEAMDQMLSAYCPHVLFPYAREVVSDLTTRATLPPVHLSPINFDAIYMQQQQQGDQKPSEQSEEEKKH